MMRVTSARLSLFALLLALVPALVPIWASAGDEDRATVSYDVGQLPVWQPKQSGRPFEVDVSLLIVAIKATVQPESWDETTLIRERSGHLLITQSRANQDKVEEFLRAHCCDERSLDPEETLRPVLE